MKDVTQSLRSRGHLLARSITIASIVYAELLGAFDGSLHSRGTGLNQQKNAAWALNYHATALGSIFVGRPYMVSARTPRSDPGLYWHYEHLSNDRLAVGQHFKKGLNVTLDSSRTPVAYVKESIVPWYQRAAVPPININRCTEGLAVVNVLRTITPCDRAPTHRRDTITTDRGRKMFEATEYALRGDATRFFLSWGLEGSGNKRLRSQVNVINSAPVHIGIVRRLSVLSRAHAVMFGINGWVSAGILVMLVGLVVVIWKGSNESVRRP